MSIKPSKKHFFPRSALCIAVFAALPFLYSPAIQAANLDYSGDASVLIVDPDYAAGNYATRFDDWISANPTGESPKSLAPTDEADNPISGNNTVTITASDNYTAPYNIYGGYSSGSSSSSNYNTVTMSGGTADYILYGGFSSSGGTASNNTVTMSGGSVYAIISGDATNSPAEYNQNGGSATSNNNKVTIEGNAQVRLNIIGGYAQRGNAAGNIAEVKDNASVVYVYGGYGGSTNVTDDNNVTTSTGVSNVSNNEVFISGGSVGSSSTQGRIAGGYSVTKGDATGNEVTITGGTVYADIYGGYTRSGDATDNTVTVDGVDINGNIYGGYARSGAATGNTVKLSSSAISGNVYGGYSGNSGGAFTGNTLNITASDEAAVSVGGNIANFSTGNFDITGLSADSDGAVTVAGKVTLGNGTEKTKINISGVDYNPASDEAIILIAAKSISGSYSQGTIAFDDQTEQPDYIADAALSYDSELAPTKLLLNYILSWYAEDPNAAHGTFTLTDADDTFTVTQALVDRTIDSTENVAGWDGTTLTKKGNGTLILSGANTYSGSTAIEAGTLKAGATNALSGKSDISIATGATLDLNGFNNSIGALSGSTGAIVTNSGDSAATLTSDTEADNDTVFAGTIQDGSQATSLTLSGEGVLTLKGTNTYTGNTTVSGGTLVIGGSGSLGSGNYAGNIVIASDAELDYASSADQILSGSLSGSGSIVKEGSSTLTFNGDGSTFTTGTTTVSSGTLTVGDADNTSAVLGGDVTASSGSTLGGYGTVGGNVVVSGTLTPGETGKAGTFSIGGSLTLKTGSSVNYDFGADAASSDLIDVDGSVSVESSTINISGYSADGTTPETRVAIDAAGGITGTDNITLTVAGQSLNDVDFLQGVTGSLNSGATEYSITIKGLSWYGEAVDSSTGKTLAHGNFTITGDDPFTLGTALKDRSDTVTYSDESGNIWDGKSLTKKGDGTLILTGENTYTGSTTINAGTLQIGEDGALGYDSATGTGNYAGTIAIASGAKFDYSSSVEQTLSGNITGDGSLNQEGSGTLILTGTNTYTGGTTIESGATLQIGNGGTTGSVTGDIADNGTVVFDRRDDITFADIISGTGSLVQQGNGNLTLAGTNTYTGNTTVSGGTLTIGGSGSLGSGSYAGNISVAEGAVLDYASSTDQMLSGSLAGSGSMVKAGSSTLTFNGDGSTFTGTTTVSAGTLVVGNASDSTAVLGGNVLTSPGATLEGYGTILGNVTVSSGATLSPGTSGSVGTLTVGSVTFDAGSVYAVNVEEDGSGDLLKISDTATVNGGTVVVAAGAGTWSSGKSYLIVDTANGVEGRFSNLSSDFAFLTAALSYTDDQVWLNLTRNESAFTDVADTYNQHSTAAAISSLPANNPVVDAVVSMNAAQARAAYDKLSGEIYGSARSALLTNSRYLRDAVNTRLLAKSQIPSDRAGWISTWGHNSRTDSDGNAASATNKGWGFAIGADGNVTDHLLIGGVAGYEKTKVESRARASTADIDAYHLGAYAATTFKGIEVRGGLAYSYLSADTDRSIDINTLAGTQYSAYHGWQVQAFAEGSKKFLLTDHASLSPYLNLAHVWLNLDSAKEKGTAAALNVQSGTGNATFTTLGVRGEWELSSAVPVQLYGDLGWQYAFGDINGNTFNRFASGGSLFNVRGAAVDKNSALVGLGIKAATGKTSTLSLGYRGQFGSDTRDNALTAEWKLRF